MSHACKQFKSYKTKSLLQVVKKLGFLQLDFLVLIYWTNYFLLLLDAAAVAGFVLFCMLLLSVEYKVSRNNVFFILL
jgi:hypothetical protein